MLLSIEFHPEGSEHFFCDLDATIYKVKVDHATVAVTDENIGEVHHVLKIVEVAEDNGFEVFGARRLEKPTARYTELFDTIEGAREQRNVIRAEAMKARR